ncbi:chaperonin GroEL [Noviherbaspirillum pedocola]|uniref:Chaperonin GroEL n=1 Tax=Noviherbaspirillum pedocola TaxID=2801341 RepID=A0A934SVI9_9BURK|nr:chaperonin GroEL [Noviherbaspirillum pedocola]MBK4737596.1 chaperonin GroEL [Noviherbaspirillum pedocola]
MSAKDILFHEQARAKICDGLDILAEAVKLTLGPKGRTVVLANRYGAPTVINSGVIVAREIELPDPYENVGAQMAREVAARTSEMAGDGTTTATVLAQAIVRQGMKFVAAGFDPMDLKRGIDAAVNAVVARLKEDSRKVATSQEIAQVGTISANGDPAIGNLIAQAMERVGRDGMIKSEDGRGMENELQVVEGLQFDRGYLSPYFITDPQTGKAVLEDALVLLYPKHVSSVEELLPVLEQVIKAGKPLLIVADDLSGDALATVVINALRGTLKVCAVKAPGFGDQRKALLEDIAIVSATRVFDAEAGTTLEKLPLQALGRATRIEIERDSTAIIGGAGEHDAIRSRIEQIRHQVERAGSAHERKQLEERAARLSGGVALIKVGASTETEMKERKSRVDDALHATRAAVEEGIGAGGGVALLRARPALEHLQLENMAQRAGVNIISRALEEPLRQIVFNAGAEPDVIIDKVVRGAADFGYNAATGSFGSMMEMGIIDPTKVTRLALGNAASIASLVLTTDCIVVEHPSAQVVQPGMDQETLGI